MEFKLKTIVLGLILLIASSRAETISGELPQIYRDQQVVRFSGRIGDDCLINLSADRFHVAFQLSVLYITHQNDPSRLYNVLTEKPNLFLFEKRGREEGIITYLGRQVQFPFRMSANSHLLHVKGYAGLNYTIMCATTFVNPCGNGILDEGEQCDTAKPTSACHNCVISLGFSCKGSPSVCQEICGDAIRTENEQCDNGNATGCRNCIPDPGYKCVGQIKSTSICRLIPFCGNGVLEDGQICDSRGRPGCTSNCQVVPGFTCDSNSPSVCSNCGNGIVEGKEQCDNAGKEGCGSDCITDIGYQCVDSPSVCARRPFCGNGILEIGEFCDNGPTNGDGCSSQCRLESGFTCDFIYFQASKCSPLYACGNRIFQPYNQEQCDNGNKQGCSHSCRFDSGWICNSIIGRQSTCFRLIEQNQPICGNGIVEISSGEECDDGNKQIGDGCNNNCRIEKGWSCFNGKNCVFASQCGNGRLQLGQKQQCDDGNAVDGDGCSSNCLIEYGWFCPFNHQSYKSSCEKIKQIVAFCGDGYVQGTEQCDDGYAAGGDGCSERCTIEAGWECNTQFRRGISTCRRLQ